MKGITHVASYCNGVFSNYIKYGINTPDVQL